MEYESRKKVYVETKVFDTLEIDIKVGVTNNDDKRFYIINDISCANEQLNSPVLQNIGQDIVKHINDLEFSKSHSKIRQSWSAFYAIKEIIDIIRTEVKEKCKGYKIYFRGQGGDWPLKPTLYRDGENGYSDEFRIQYDTIYESIANKFPHEIEYSSDFGSKKRAANLAILQHYGLGTPLVDITENPFIAMLFMTNNYQYSEEHGSLKMDVFFIREDGENTLFQEVGNKDNNLRITVQKGAFLNFEKLEGALIYGEKKIDRISINLKYDNASLEQELLPDGLDDEGNNNPEIALKTAARDIQEKLTSFNYMNADLFPDFYKCLEMIKLKYTQGNGTEQPWYKIFYHKIEK